MNPVGTALILFAGFQAAILGLSWIVGSRTIASDQILAAVVTVPLAIFDTWIVMASS